MPNAHTQSLEKLIKSLDYVYIQGPDQAAELKRRVAEIAELGGPIGVDTETTGLDPLVARTRLLQVGLHDFALVVDLDGWRKVGERRVDWERPGLSELAQLLQGTTVKVLQNAAFDLNFLRAEGLELGGSLFDTMFASKIIHNGQAFKNDLGSIVKHKLKFELPKELQKADWSGEISPEMLGYAARDAVVLVHLQPVLTQMLAERSGFWEVFTLELGCLRPIALMQAHGFGFDQASAQVLHDALEQRAERMKLEFCEHLDQCIRASHPKDQDKWLPRNTDGTFNTREKDSGSVRAGTKLRKGFNPRSAQQMVQRFEDAGVRMPVNEKGKSSMDQNLLAFLRKKPGMEIVDQYLEWKGVETLLTHVKTLLAAVGPDGRIHASYRQMGTDTGRLSCAGPNLQQVPRQKEFRQLFVARSGYRIVAGDFSQVELRVAGELSGEERILDAYRAGRDLHTETAALMTGKPLEAVTKADRTSAKICNFGLLYGAGPATLQKQAVAQYGIDMEFETAKELVANFREAYPRLLEWQQAQGTSTTRSVFTKTGRRRYLAGTYNDKYTTRINTVVQGTAGDIAKIAIAQLWRELQQRPRGEAYLIAMCHDELVLEVREDVVEVWAALLKRVMEQAGEQVCKKVPIVAEVSWGQTWADAK